jgi:hypothetical protein
VCVLVHQALLKGVAKLLRKKLRQGLRWSDTQQTLVEWHSQRTM